MGCVATACGSVANKQPDAATTHDGPGMRDATAGSGDAPAVCNPTGAFGTPMLVDSLNTAGDDEGAPRFTADELQAVLNRTNSGSTDSDLYIANRASTSTAFGTPAAMTAENTTSNEYNPTVSSDGLTLFFDSTRSGSHIWVATRTTTLGSFGAPSQVAEVTSNANDVQPFITADGQELWFTSDRAGGLGGYDIYRAVKSGNAFGTPEAVPGLSSADDEILPVVSADKLTAYFASDRAGGMGGTDIWMSHRSTTADSFPAPTVVPELSSSAIDYPGWISPDNCRFYFASNRGTTYDVYVATRQP
jgi:Tol biopolymer transport system component